jgi:hypothetical protein
MTLLSFLVLAFILRLSGLASSNLWYDELVSLRRATEPLTQYLTDPSDYIGVNLWEIILRFFAWGPHWVIRLPALACAMLSLWLAWKIMLSLHFSNDQMTISALTMACLPGLLWMAQDARYYAPLTALYMASMLAALRGKVGWLTACIILSFLIHPIGPAYTVPAISLAWMAKTLSWRKVIVVSGLSGFAWIIYFMLNTMDTSASFWTSQLTWTSFIYEYGQSVTVNTMGGAGIMLVFVASLVLFLIGLVFGVIKLPKLPITLLIWSGPLAILIIVSLVYQNVITYRTLQPAAMGLALMTGRVLAFDLRWRWTWIPAGALLMALLLNWDPSARGGDLDAVADHIRGEWRAGDVLVYSSDAAMPLDLLLGDLPHCQLDTHDCTLDQDRRTWLVWSPTLMSDTLNDELINATAGMVSVDRTANAWQIVPMNVYLLEK